MMPEVLVVACISCFFISTHAGIQGLHKQPLRKTKRKQQTCELLSFLMVASCVIFALDLPNNFQLGQSFLSSNFSSRYRELIEQLRNIAFTTLNRYKKYWIFFAENENNLYSTQKMIYFSKFIILFGIFKRRHISFTF